MNHPMQGFGNSVPSLINFAHCCALLLGKVAPDNQLVSLGIADLPCTCLAPVLILCRHRLRCRPIGKLKQTASLAVTNPFQWDSTVTSIGAPLKPDEFLTLQLFISVTGCQLAIPPLWRHVLDVRHIDSIGHAATFILVAQDRYCT